MGIESAWLRLLNTAKAEISCRDWYEKTIWIDGQYHFLSLTGFQSARWDKQTKC